MVRKILRGLVAAAIFCFVFRLPFGLIFPFYPEWIDYGVEALATAAAAYSQFITLPRHIPPSLRLRWTLWIVYLVLRTHLIGLAAFGPIMPHFVWMRGYLLTASVVDYTAFLFALAIPSFAKGSNSLRKVEIGLSAILATAFLLVRMQYREGGSQLRYFLFIACYQLFLALSAQLATRAATSVAEYSLCRRMAAYSFVLLVFTALVNSLSLYPDAPFAHFLVSFSNLETLLLLWLTSRGFVRPLPRLPAEAVYAVRSGLPLLITLAIVGLSISLIPVHPAFAVTAILLGIVGYGFRTAVLMSQHLVAQDDLVRDRIYLQRLVYTDSLTGAGNRRSFASRLEEAHQNQLRGGQAFSLLMFDIDKFKDLNDSLGHPFGDSCLQMVVDVVRRVAVRSGDHLARMGGDEFALILPRTHSSGANVLAHHIQKALAEATVDFKMPLNVSIGVATSLSAARTSTDALIAAADEGLYRAKKAGGGCVRVADIQSSKEGGNSEDTKDAK